MSISIGIDPASNVSRELVTVIESEIKRPDHYHPPTLGSVLESMYRGLYQELASTNRIDPDVEQSILDELKALVEDFGGDAPAEEFMHFDASPELAAVIENILDQSDPDQPPTLVTVRDALAQGLGASLTGNGVLDQDEDDTLLIEVDELIDMHGADTPAEFFLR